MTQRDPLWTQNAGPTGILDVADTRIGTAAVWLSGSHPRETRSGFRPWAYSTTFVFATTPTPDGNVHVQAHQLILQTVRASTGGAYVLTSDAQTDINILSTPANPTNPRDDLIIARVTDTFYGDGSSVYTVEQIVGTPAAVPVDPTVTGSQDYVPLARVRVIANATGTDITQARITDLRTSGHAKSLPAGLFAVASGGVLPVATSAQRDAITGKYNGLAVWRTDTKQVEVYDGSVFRIIAPRVVAKTASVPLASSTSLTPDPQLLMSVDANRRYRLHGRLIYNSLAAADFKFGWTYPASTIMAFTVLGTAAGGSGLSTFEQTEVSVSSMEGTGAGETLYIDGVVTTAGTAGTLTLTWAQNVSNATGTEVMISSYFELLEI